MANVLGNQHIMRKWLCFLMIVFVGVTTLVFSQPSASSAKDAQIWNLQNADIRAVIQTVSQLTGKNFVVDPRVQGKITIVSSKPMSIAELYQVFLSMLQLLNYAAVPTSCGVIKIVPMLQAKEYGGALSTNQNPGSGDEIVVRVVAVNNIPVAQLVPTLHPLMQDWGTITAYAPSNTLILSGTAANVNRLVKIIHQMDRSNMIAVQVVPLHHVEAKKLVAMLDSLTAAQAKIGKSNLANFVADEQINAVVVSANSAELGESIGLIRSLDKPNTLSATETMVIHLNYLSAKQLAPILTKIAQGKIIDEKKTKGGATSAVANAADIQHSDVSVQAENSDNAIIIHAPVKLAQSLRNVVRQLDLRPNEVLVQAIVVRVGEHLLSQLGVQWGTSDDSVSVNGNSISNFIPGMGFIPDGNIKVLLQALTTDASTDILATPSVVVLNNRPALINDGKNVGIVNRQYAGVGAPVSDNSALPFNTIQRQDVTLQLKVTPQIAPNNTVNLAIEQQDNSLDPDSASGPDNPTIDTSRIKTTVLVNSGDILVLGGLISNDNKQNQIRIPILSDIPIIGYLFRYKNHDIEKKNLMVFIRPVILHSRFDKRHETNKKYNYMREQQLRSKSGKGLDIYNKPLLPPMNTKKWVEIPSPHATEAH